MISFFKKTCCLFLLIFIDNQNFFSLLDILKKVFKSYQEYKEKELNKSIEEEKKKEIEGYFKQLLNEYVEKYKEKENSYIDNLADNEPYILCNLFILNFYQEIKSENNLSELLKDTSASDSKKTLWKVLIGQRAELKNKEKIIDNLKLFKKDIIEKKEIKEKGLVEIFKTKIDLATNILNNVQVQ